LSLLDSRTYIAFCLFPRVLAQGSSARIHFTLVDAVRAAKTEALDWNSRARFLLHFRHMARQRLGQHFLSDAGWREQIVRAIGVSPHSTLRAPAAALEPAKAQAHCWIEVGAGHGEMTEHLLSTGSAVYAVELDALLAARLQKLAKKFPNLTVVHEDVLETDLAAIAAGRRIRLYGNLPYYITSPILHHFFSFADLIDEIHIVIQEEVALRLTAKPETKQYGYLSVVTQLYTRPEFVLRIPRGAFSPAPEIGSALVTLRLPGERAKLSVRDEAAFLDFVKLSFAQKRKTLVNNLRSLASPDAVRATLTAQNLRVDARAEQLSVAQFAALHASLAAAC
jgi:16S rRNA (adenine1518-N6/adenine1519-N6)-dimethyltransferase